MMRLRIVRVLAVTSLGASRPRARLMWDIIEMCGDQLSASSSAIIAVKGVYTWGLMLLMPNSVISPNSVGQFRIVGVSGLVVDDHAIHCGLVSRRGVARGIWDRYSSEGTWKALLRVRLYKALLETIFAI
jgi:hypothetical protein